MSTLYRTTTSSNPSSIGNSIRYGLAVAGIVIAIISSLALVRDGHITERMEANDTVTPENSEVVSGNLMTKIKSIALTVAVEAIQ